MANMVWIDLVQFKDKWGAVLNAVMKFGVLYNAGKFLCSCEPVTLSGKTLPHVFIYYLVS